MKVYTAFNSTDTFELIPAVRHPTGGACVEEKNCNWELATLCAFNQTNQAGQVAFLACMDEREGMAPTSSKYCAKKQGLDDDKLNACYSGAQGASLLSQASAAFNKLLPGPATVPHLFLDAVDYSKTHKADYNDLKTAMCAAGSTASVCAGGDVTPLYSKCLV